MKQHIRIPFLPKVLALICVVILLGVSAFVALFILLPGPPSSLGLLYSYPHWVAPYPGGQIVSENTFRRECTSHTVSSPDSIAQVAEYYHTSHLAAGWSINYEHSYGAENPNYSYDAEFTLRDFIENVTVRPDEDHISHAYIMGRRSGTYDLCRSTPGLR